MYQYEGRVERGALLYANNCRTCHGNAGQGGVGLPLNTDAYKDQSPLVLAHNQQKRSATRSSVAAQARHACPPGSRRTAARFSERQIEHLVEFITQPATEN